MAAFVKLEDSPMFHKQSLSTWEDFVRRLATVDGSQLRMHIGILRIWIFTLEQTNEDLKDRCLRLHKGCTKFMTSLQESCNGDTAFADSLEAFGGGQDDPVSVLIGGPVISKFTSALHELASYKELLSSQVEHVLVDRLMQFLNVDMQDAKESRRRFDKAEQAYDQARNKFLSLKKSTHEDVVAEHEEELQNSKSAFERSRFGLVNALMNIESKKKYEFLESISAIMDAHLRFFKLGYELLSQLEPFIHQVLTYAQQSKEMATTERDKLAKRIQEFRTQAELDNLRASSNVEPTISTLSVHPAHGNSYKDIEAIMQSSANGEVHTIKQGYLSKRSSSTRGEWKRRYFVLDSHGTLYYYRNKSNKPQATQSNYSRLAEHNSSVFGRFLLKHNKTSSLGEETLRYQVIDLRTSTIKFDADEREMRLCFRIISPSKSYTLQAENEADQINWVNNIKAVIATLFNSQFLQLSHGSVKNVRKDNSAKSASLDVTSADDNENSDHFREVSGADSVAIILRSIPGNNFCAECSSAEPDWASLNLGILLCIECSGLHRNLGVHVSKVRSVTLDVRVWEPIILKLFQALGNTYCNSVWEALLQDGTVRLDESESVMKPCPSDAVIQKEKYIQLKYVGKEFINKRTEAPDDSLYSRVWQAVKRNDLREVYRMLVMVIVDEKVLDADFDKIMGIGSPSHGDRTNSCEGDPANCQVMKDPKEPANCLRGCSLLHLACHEGNPVMLELLLQFGADINKQDAHGRTPLHHCIAMGNNSLAKFLLKRGACSSARDGGGFSALERAMEMGSITDEELFILLAASS